MNLGERIFRLRTEKGMSQGDLADELGVSRQSISKWETNGAVPELDKLVKLSEVFGVTLDELVIHRMRTDKPEGSKEQEPKVIYVQSHGPGSGKKVAGVALLCFSALVWLMVTLLGDVVAGLVLAVPFAGCGLICLLVKKNAGLLSAWVVYFWVDFYLRFATGINWQYVFFFHIYSGEWTAQLVTAWCLFAVFSTLTAVTAFRSRKEFPGDMHKDLIGTVSGWLVYVITWFVFAMPLYDARKAVAYSESYRYVSSVSGLIKTVIMVTSLVFTIRLIVGLLEKRHKK